MYNNCINLGDYWQIICKHNLRICILYYRISAWIHGGDCVYSVCTLIFPSFRISLNNSSECPAGYTGRDCKFSCLYPFYGEDCLMRCECSPETCDFVSGCEVTSKTVTSSEHHTTNSKDVVFPCEFYRNYCGKNNALYQFYGTATSI